MKCRECGAPAEYIYYDDDGKEFVPLCPYHMEEVIRFEGEINIEFFAMSEVERLVDAVNEKLKYMDERYKILFKRLRGL
jgi:hypothetical protein